MLQLSDNYDSLLSTILIGNNIVNIGCSSLATILFVKLLGEEMGAGISTLVITVVVLIFGEFRQRASQKNPRKNSLVFRTDDQWASDRPDTDQLDVRAVEEAVVLLFKTSGSQGITSEELFTIVEEARKREALIKKKEAFCAAH